MTTLAELTDGAHKRSFMNIAVELIRFERKSDCKFVTLLIRFGKKFLVERLKSIIMCKMLLFFNQIWSWFPFSRFSFVSRFQLLLAP